MRLLVCLATTVLALLTLPARAEHWQFLNARVTQVPSDRDGWLNSAMPSDTGVVLSTQLSPSSSHPDHGQVFVSKGTWTLPPEVLIPGRRLSFELNLTGQKVELGGHWHLGHSFALYAGAHKAGAPAARSDGLQRIAAVGTGTSAGAPKSDRAAGEWTVPAGNPALGLSVRIEGSPGEFGVTYFYAWVSGPLPPQSAQGKRVEGNGATVAGGPRDQAGSPGRSGTAPETPDVSVTSDDGSAGTDPRLTGAGTTQHPQADGKIGAPDKPAQELELFRNGNDGGVSNGAKAARFSLSRAARITSILSYHYNQGRGAPGGTLQVLAEDGTLYGAWPVEVVNKVYWIARPGVTLPPGNYQVIDSDPSTWSQNAGSKGQGHVIIKGHWGNAPAGAAPKARVQNPPTTPAPAPTAVAPRLNGTWRGTYNNSRNEPGPYEITLTEDNGRIEGTNDGMRILDGKRVGDTITWRMQSGGSSWSSKVRILDGGNTLVEDYTGHDQRRDKDNGTYTGQGTLHKK